MSKVDLYAALRRDARAGLSSRALESKYRVGRRTVTAALASAWPKPRKPLPPRASKLDPFKPVVDDILRADLDAPRKQRHTIKRIYDRLIDEHGMADVSYPVVRAYVAVRGPQIRIEAGRGPVNVFVPQVHRPGVEAEVDFGEVVVNLRGEPVTCMLFAFRMSFSGKSVHRIFASGGQEAFLEGLIGDSGTGKSHLLIALGSEAAMAGYRVRYVLATKLVNELVEAADDKILAKTIARYGRVDLLCIDELGYMELDRRGAELLFQVLTEREEKNSVAIASNESFSGWTKTFTDPRLCAAIVDRLTFGGNIIETGTDSYRLAQTRARAEQRTA